jgi:UDP-N-acetylmuramate--alanine ligase
VAFTVNKVRFEVPQPGRYTVLNALAAIAMAREAGVTLVDMVEPLRGFAGVARRFVSVGTAGGVEVIDDFAHNPDKIAAALGAARDRLAGTGGRVLAVFQPHGFGPTRFLRDELVAAFAGHLREADVLWLPEIFYAGGTVEKDISSADIVADIAARGRDARFCADRDDLPAAIAAEACPGDLALVMGARDPSLTSLARAILAALG